MDALIYDCLRTPRGKGKKDGALHPISPLNVSAQMLKALKARQRFDLDFIEDVIFGIVDPIKAQGGDLPRIAVMAADYPDTIPGVQINRFCASGLEAVNMAASKVMAGQAQAVIAGGVEMMSQIPMMASGGSWSVDPSVAIPHYFVPQGISADLIATKEGFTREQVDNYAVMSQLRAKMAWETGRFERSIVPVLDGAGKITLAKDELVRPTDIAGLSTLKPSFQFGEKFGFDAVAIDRYPTLERINHVHHAGNSSGIADGASLVLVGTPSFGQLQSIKPRARIRAFTSIGSEPCIMLTGPIAVTEKVLKMAKMSIKDIDLFEVNEAFAAVVLMYLKAFKLPIDKVNVNGGAIAMGHPLGATGAMLLGTLLDELERRDLTTGLVTLCVGAGMGTAMIIERV